MHRRTDLGRERESWLREFLTLENGIQERHDWPGLSAIGKVVGEWGWPTAPRVLTPATCCSAAPAPSSCPGYRVPPLGTHANAPVALRVRVGTGLEQIAVAPGRLTGEWAENGRRFFAYEADARTSLRERVCSGRYATSSAVRRGVAVHVHHHPAHSWRVPSLFRLVDRQLSRVPSNGDYPHRVLHLVETPEYRPVAQPPSLLALGWRDAKLRRDVTHSPHSVVLYSESARW